MHIQVKSKKHGNIAMTPAALNKILTNSSSVKQICKPIFDLVGISYFDWLRTFTNGKRLRLTSYPQWTEHYYKQSYYLASKFERNPQLYRSGFSIWDYQNYQDENPYGYNIHNDMRNNFNRDHGFSITKVNSDYMDSFIFTTTTHNHQINENYLKHMDELNKFTQYFLNASSKLILQIEAEKLPVLLAPDVFNTPNGSSLLSNPITKNFNEITKIEKLLITYKGKVIKLSKRQTQCLIELAHGKKYKEIGNSLNLEEKTVNYYIANIKSKLDCPNLSDIFPQILKY